MKTTRRQFITAVGAAATGLASSSLSAKECPKRSKPQRQPNILVIMTDQHSKHFLGCYGNHIVRTPNLDRLANEGMRFDSAYCPAPLCVPSRMSFLTGRTPSRNRVWHNQGILASGIPTWAHVLAAEGYETSLIGRMHFAGPDQRHGFMNRPIGEYSAKYPGSPYKSSYPKPKAHYHGGSGQRRSCVELAGRGKTSYQHFDEQIVDKACQYITERSRSSKKPFAATVGLVLPHCPFIAPKPLYNYYADKVDPPRTGGDVPPTIRRFRKLRGILEPLPEKRIRIARTAYYGMCEHLDMLIGKILSRLDDTGLAENTLVVYCTDHGEMAGEHDCWWKSNYYEGSANVPMIARLPGVVPSNSASDAVCNLMDIGPTLAEIAGGKMPDVDGRSLWKTLQERRDEEWVDETYSEFCDMVGRAARPCRMIRSDKWKLWLYADDERLPPTLFNLEEDPHEMHDLGSDPATAKIREKLIAKIFDRWNPQDVSRGSRQALTDWKTLSRWGSKVQPPCPDALEVPPPSLEADVELL
ncbi:MAG: sulfatase-like hydrolase/transferase [Pirellulales bacterium]|nr:sulfatase-like hydrolase/transferase [Pirellulales bacterium]